MSAKEKAKELVDKYLDLDNYNNLNLDLFCDECGMSTDAAKQCALIAVDTVLFMASHYATIDYWNEVKHEIEQL
jgi:hypothetical protein